MDIYNECINILDATDLSAEDKIGKLFDIFVPSSGSCDTVGGEIVRAYVRLLYRWRNDGDRFFCGIEDLIPYNETCCRAAAHLYMTCGNAIKNLIDNCYEMEYNKRKYSQFLVDLGELVVQYLQENPDVFDTYNKIDFIDEYDGFVDCWITNNEEYLYSEDDEDDEY